jgi:hypothetical protein
MNVWLSSLKNYMPPLNALKGIASSISDVSKLAEIVKTSLPLLESVIF